MKKKIEILETTLRDGTQAEGISYSIEDKLAMTKIFDNLAFTYIEGGNPYANPKDKEYFEKVKTLNLKNSKIVAFGSTMHKGGVKESDLSLKALNTANTDTVCIFGKCSVNRIEKILDTDCNENLRMISESVKYLKDNGKHVIFDAEHFFEAFKENKDYALSALKSAYENGAETLVLCDTNGDTFPDKIFDITKEIVKLFPNEKIGIHAHNDCGLAVANTILAVQAGAKHVQGTFVGFGERCGNANLSAIIPNLQLKLNYDIIPKDCLANFTRNSRNVAEISNISLPHNLPYVGKSAFSHKAGMHSDGVIKSTEAFEHISPELVGNERKFLLSEIAGRAVFIKKLTKMFPDLSFTDKQAVGLLQNMKNLEKNGYEFEGADASLYLFVKKSVGKFTSFFDLIDFSVTSNHPSKNKNKSSVATVTIKVKGTDATASGTGNGPVDALDYAIRLALSEFYPSIKKVTLADYKVRVLNSEAATGAMVRVLITSTDGVVNWTTVGVSTDIIEASWIALCDSMEYHLENL